MQRVGIYFLFLLGLSVSACGDENTTSPSEVTESTDEQVPSDTTDDAGVSENQEASNVADEVEDSEPPTECEIACYEQYEAWISAEDCDAWCHATSDQWLSGCLAECSSNT